MKHLLFVFLFISSTFLSSAQSDSMTSESIKELLEGKWKSNGSITRFIFNSDTSGTWKTDNIISSAPLFIIYRSEGAWCVGSIDILGSGEPYPLQIVQLDKKALVLVSQSTGVRLTFKRKRL